MRALPDRWKDGRILVVTVLLLYVLAIVLGSQSQPYYLFWRHQLGVPTLSTPFRDLLVVTSAWDCSRLGYDVLVENPCNLGAVPMNYPRLWLALGWLGWGRSQTWILGVGLGIGFFVAVLGLAGRLTLRDGVIYTIVLCSPSVMLGVERGNNDLVVFSLLVLSLGLLQSRQGLWHYSAYGGFLGAALLKLYPIAALMVVLREPRRRGLWVLAISGVMFVAYGLATLADIRIVNADTPRSTIISYGSLVLLDKLLIPDRLLQVGGLGQFITYDTLRIFLGTIVSFLLIIPPALMALGQRSAPRSSQQRASLPLDSFRLGASLYVATFTVVGNNWDYRLIYLIFTLPQLLTWISHRDSPKPSIVVLTLGCTLLTLWLSRWSPFNLDELLNGCLVASLTYLMVATAPEGLTRWLLRPVAHPSTAAPLPSR